MDGRPCWTPSAPAAGLQPKVSRLLQHFLAKLGFLLKCTASELVGE